MQSREGQFSVAVHGAESFGLQLDSAELDDRNYRLQFIPYRTEQRLAEFDGVITFQQLFERFEHKSNYMRSWWAHSYDQDELDKRAKEADILVKNGGFIVFLLHVPFRDRVYQNGHSTEYKDTDLAKRFLNWNRLYRTDLDQRYTGLRCVRDEFRQFFDLYGAVVTTFSYHGGLSWRNLALRGSNPVSMVIADRLFFVPCLLPNESSGRKEEFYRLLSDAVVTCVKKLRVALPAWADDFLLPNEQVLVDEQSALSARLEQLEKERAAVTRFKRVLLGDGDSLVEDVVHLLTQGFGFTVDPDDYGQEDLRILNDEGNPLVFTEVKGTTRGVKREHVNQADSHRERAGLSADFPTVLLINTHTKNSRSIGEKDQDVASEQVAHAVKMRVLIVRTLDLLNLLALLQKNLLNKDDILSLLQTNIGWLKVSGKEIEIRKE